MSRMPIASTVFAILMFVPLGGANSQIVDRPEVSINAKAGQRHRVLIFWNINEDCSTIRGFSVVVGKQPDHGFVDLRKEEQTITLDMAKFALSFSDGPRYRRAMECLGKKTFVINAYYRSKNGFFGSDRFQFLFLAPGGQRGSRRTIRMFVA